MLGGFEHLPNTRQPLFFDVRQPDRSDAFNPHQFIHVTEWLLFAEFDNLTRPFRPDVDDPLQFLRTGSVDVDARGLLSNSGRGMDEDCHQRTATETRTLTRLTARNIIRLAELERSLIVERVNAGLSRAKRQGKTLGRPRLIVDREKVSKLAGEGLSIRKIASKLQLTKSTVHNLLSA